MAQNVYGPGVRIGNWNEDIYLEEERMRHFLEKREKGELLIQRSRRLKKNILRPMQLSVSEDGYVHYGDKVILVNPDHVTGDEAGVFMKGDLSLSMSPDEVKAQLTDDLQIPCGVSAVQTTVPTGRNTFTILSDSANNCSLGQVVVYGQNFCLGIAAGLEGKMLYLTSDHRTLLKSSVKSWLQEVTLTDDVTHLNCWQAAFLDPQLRLEYEGFPVRETGQNADSALFSHPEKANEKVVIYHRHTNRALAAHRNLFLRTYFGKEVEVAAHTHLDSHKVEKPKNHWMLVTGNPRNKSSTMLDIFKPITEDTCAVEQAMGINTNLSRWK